MQAPARFEHLRTPTPWRAVRIVLLGLAQAITLLLLAWLLDSVTIDNVVTALGVVVVLGLMNALIWPLVVRLALPLIVLTVGFVSFAPTSLAAATRPSGTYPDVLAIR